MEESDTKFDPARKKFAFGIHDRISARELDQCERFSTDRNVRDACAELRCLRKRTLWHNMGVEDPDEEGYYELRGDNPRVAQGLYYWAIHPHWCVWAWSSQPHEIEHKGWRSQTLLGWGLVEWKLFKLASDEERKCREEFYKTKVK
jgi:hypothetical protein